MRTNSLLTKMVVFGCITCILPVLFVGVFSYIQSSKQVREQIGYGEMNFIKQVNSNIEQVLITVDQTLYNLVDSTEMEAALRRPLSGQDFRLYGDLRKEAIHLQSFDTKVDDVIILNEQWNWIMKNNGLYRLSEHPDREKYLSYLDLNRDSSWVLVKDSDFSDPISKLNCGYTVSLVKKLPVRKVKKYALAFANIPTCSLAQMIQTNRESEQVMILNEEHQIVVHPDPSLIGKTLPEAGFEVAEEDLSAASGQFKTSIEKHPFMVTYYRSGYNQWVYLSATSIDQITRESKKIGWFTFYISLSIIIISVIFVWFITRRLYSPVNKLVKYIEENWPEHYEKKENELQVIEEHVKSLFSSNSKMEKELKEHTQQVRFLFLNRLYTGNLHADTIKEKLHYFGLDQYARYWKQMTVLTLQVDTLENTIYQAKDMELVLFAVSNIVEETLPQQNCLPPVWIDQTLVTLIGMDDEHHQRMQNLVYELTEQLQNNIERYLDLSVSIGISLPFREWKKTSRAYTEGLEALKHRLKLGSGVIIHFSSVNSGKHSYVYQYPERAEKDMQVAIKIGDEKKALEQLRIWTDKAFEKAQSARECQISMMRLLNNLMVLKQESGIRFEQIDALHASLYEELLTLHTKEEIHKWFKERVVLPLVQVFKDRSDSQFHALSEQIIDLIQQYYDRDITLEECASRLHYNANYLSSVFKKETNHTFSEYLSMYRLNMAKKWLTETDITVKEISDRLRYKNPQNFIRSFKKQEGMTPGQYREKYGNL